MTDNTFKSQWSNPGDILSLLLLIGGDIVQKAIAQLVGYTIEPFGKNNLHIGITPVAFSFGWVAYGFTNLLSAVGEKSLMPTADCPSIVVNCANAFTRVNQSWALGRLLRDHETSHNVDPRKGRAESIRIDIFELGIPSKPTLDLTWWSGWLTIVTQIGIASLPWALYGNWEVIMIVICGNLLAQLTCALPQWRQEKWAGRTLDSENVTCLTRGNGYLHIMVFIGRKGSWNFESLATAISTPQPETPVVSLALALLWTCLLISVSAIKEHAWYLASVGCIGMLQNVCAAGKARDPSTSNFHFTKFSRMPTIIGKRRKLEDDVDSVVDLDETLADVSGLVRWSESVGLQVQPNDIQTPKWLDSMEKKDGVPAWLETARAQRNGVANVHGALQELEKWVPTAGLAMMQIFFPTSLRYRDDNIRDNVDKKFWKRAYHTKNIRKRAENKRREVERGHKKEEEEDKKPRMDFSGLAEV